MCLSNTDLGSDTNTGKFWADRIKDLRGEPARRLGLAFENLPLPGAFREASIATRALIRSKRKAGDEFEEELRLLYWFRGGASSCPSSDVGGHRLSLLTTRLSSHEAYYRFCLSRTVDRWRLGR